MREETQERKLHNDQQHSKKETQQTVSDPNNPLGRKMVDEKKEKNTLDVAVSSTGLEVNSWQVPSIGPCPR